MENLNNTGKVIGALLVGALIGAAAGVLFAPDKGGRTRSKLVRNTKYMAEDIQSRINEEINSLRSKVDELSTMAETKVDEIISAIKPKVDGLAHRN